MRMLRRSGVMAPAIGVLALVGVLAGCSSNQEKQAPPKTPAEVVSSAADTLASTTGAKIEVSTPGLPQGVNGLVKASGTIIHAPAFQGTVWVSVGGNTVEVPVISVDNTVHAMMPLTTGWTTIDPTEYNAFDPAGLISSERGLPGALKAMTGVTAGEQRRGGANNTEVLTQYTGTVPGPAMKKVIPSASGDSFATTLTVTDGGELREASFTGVFYANSTPMTYTMQTTEYGSAALISAP